MFGGAEVLPTTSIGKYYCLCNPTNLFFRIFPRTEPHFLTDLLIPCVVSVRWGIVVYLWNHQTEM